MENPASRSSAPDMHGSLGRPSILLGGVIAAAAVALIPAAALLAQPASAPFTVVESGRGFGSLQQAVDAIGNGQGSIAIRAGTYRECAVQQGGSVSYLASNAGEVIFDGTTCEGKAALVLRGENASIAGLVFKNMAVPDYNGAGIRLETGNLTVTQSWFLDSQQGILTANGIPSRIVIDRSTFSGLGTCEGAGGCAHSIYVGRVPHLRITRSRFERGSGGHYVKSRAVRTDVAASSFDDSAGSSTNYMIDLPSGSAGQITNNWFVQGRDKENYSAFIAVSPEGRENPTDDLLIAGNDARFVPGLSRKSAFVADWGAGDVTVEGNTIGAGITRYERR
ncbi:right-handed parallel beta-helix repeat-containing protein [Erythrobacteraceae bacterium WH01K]|nr:right-handed parallel beta-helix repeat-containing protein [Erythrobacteraceae bacterium WH01K]